MVERTLIIFKPDCLRRGLVSTLLRKWEDKGFHIEQLKVATPSTADMASHYAEHFGKSFYRALIERYTISLIAALSLTFFAFRMTTADCIFMVISGVNAIQWSRETIMAIRRDRAANGQENLVHGSDSLISAEKEIAIWFP